MTEYEKVRQQVLKAREDTICFTIDELQTIIGVLKEVAMVAGWEKRRRLFLQAYAIYRRSR